MKINKNNLLMMGVLASILTFTSCLSDDSVSEEQERYLNDLELIDTYLTNNNIEAEIDPSTGIRYVIHDQGTGLQPYLQDSVILSYTGTVLNEESPFADHDSLKTHFNVLVDGLEFALSRIQEGGSITAYVPSAFAYGTTGTTGVPANSVVEFNVDFHEYRAKQLKQDLQAIQDSLDNWGVTASVHPSGIRYILDQGNGAKPTVNSTININYEGRLLGSEQNFDEGTSASFLLRDLIIGWQIMMPMVQTGGSITMYLPSSFAYGSRGAGNSIPPNANLVFEIDLLGTN